MAYLNVKNRTLEAKIVYYGAGLSGKTTNLEQIKALSEGATCGEMMALDTEGERTLFFDYLPFDLGNVNGCAVRMQLYTVPGQPKLKATRKRVLAASDGIVLVLDSQSGALDRNREVTLDLWEHMRENGLARESVPVLVQLNKRDLPTAMAPEEMLAALELTGLPFHPAVASRGEGIFETLHAISKLVLTQIRELGRSDSKILEMGSESALSGDALLEGLEREGIAPQRQRAANVIEMTPRQEVTQEARLKSGTNGGAPAHASNVAVSATIHSRQVATPAPVKVRSTRGDSVFDDLRHEVEPAAVGRAHEPPASVGRAHETDELRQKLDLLLANSRATQWEEILAGQRALTRRFDLLEAAMNRSAANFGGEVERAISSRLARLEDPAPRLAALEAALGTFESRLVELQLVVDASLAESKETHGKVAELNVQPSTLLAKLGSTYDELRSMTVEVLETRRDVAELEIALRGLQEGLGSVTNNVARQLEAHERLASLVSSVDGAVKDVVDQGRGTRAGLGTLINGQSALAARVDQVAQEGMERYVGVEARLQAAIERAAESTDKVLDSRLGALVTRIPALEKVPSLVEDRIRTALGSLDQRLMSELGRLVGAQEAFDSTRRQDAKTVLKRLDDLVAEVHEGTSAVTHHAEAKAVTILSRVEDAGSKLKLLSTLLERLDSVAAVVSTTRVDLGKDVRASAESLSQRVQELSGDETSRIFQLETRIAALAESLRDGFTKLTESKGKNWWAK